MICNYIFFTISSTTCDNTLQPLATRWQHMSNNASIKPTAAKLCS